MQGWKYRLHRPGRAEARLARPTIDCMQWAYESPATLPWCYRACVNITGFPRPGHDNRRDPETLPAALQAQQCAMLQALPMLVQDTSPVSCRICVGWVAAIPIDPGHPKHG